jgi:hypothetical protein
MRPSNETQDPIGPPSPISCLVRGSGQGRDRTADLPLFSQYDVRTYSQVNAVMGFSMQLVRAPGVPQRRHLIVMLGGWGGRGFSASLESAEASSRSRS